MAPNRSLWKRLRTYTGLLSAWLLHLGSLGLFARTACSPAFACHGCPWATLACPIGVLAHGSVVRSLPVFAIGFVLAIGAALGRLVCGFLCPFGWFQDLLYRIPTRKVRLPRWSRWGKYAALILLVGLLPYLLGQYPLGHLDVAKPAVRKLDNGQLEVKVTVENRGATPVDRIDLIAVYRDLESGGEVFRSPEPISRNVVVAPGARLELAAFAIPNLLARANLEIQSPQRLLIAAPRFPLYYCQVCPLGTLTAHLPRYGGAGATPTSASRLARENALRLAVFAFFLVLMVLASRAFCRTFCPLGAIYGLCSRLALLRLRLRREDCVDCGRCDKVCPVELDVRRELSGPECIACGDCIRACPKAAIQRTVGLG